MKITIILSALVLSAVLLAGCSEQSEDTDASTDTGTAVKTMDEYRNEAEQQITEDNAEAELDKIEQEMQGE